MIDSSKGPNRGKDKVNFFVKVKFNVVKVKIKCSSQSDLDMVWTIFLKKDLNSNKSQG